MKWAVAIRVQVYVAEMDSLQELQIGREKAMKFPDEGAGEWSHPLLS